jgi:hypothetical protein
MPAGQSRSFLHSAHVPFSPQKGVGALQFASVVHCTHRPAMLQVGVDVPLQSAAVTHWTHDDVAVSQCAAVAGHWLSCVQPLRQVKSCGSQTGAAAPQSALVTQLTHAFLKHRGALRGQSASAAHSTQVCVLVLQILGPCVQSADVRQPMQAPLAVSQIGARSREHWALLVHAVWHV